MKSTWFICIFCLSVTVASARTLIVAADSSAEFIHIGDAADSAQFGDTVLVRDGLHQGYDPTGGEEISVGSAVVVVAEHPGHVAVTVAPWGITLHGSAKLMGLNLATNPIAHLVHLVSIVGGPATVYNCGFHCGMPNSMGAQVTMQADGRPPFIQACAFQWAAPIALIYNTDSTNIWMPGNYFETTDSSFIHLGIEDGFRDPDIGYVYISPVSDSFEWLGIDAHTSIAASDLSLRAYPNPFNPSTTISFSLERTSRVRLRVFDVIGRQVQSLANERFDAGEHEIPFEGLALPSGIYFARVEAGPLVRTQKMVLLK